jgi:hypothetical protein
MNTLLLSDARTLPEPGLLAPPNSGSPPKSPPHQEPPVWNLQPEEASAKKLSRFFGYDPTGHAFGGLNE